MSNLTNSDKSLLEVMRNHPAGFRLPSVVINNMLKRLEKMMVVYSLPDTQGQSLWYLQDDYLHG